MLDLSLTRIRHSKDLPVTADTVVREEGLPLVQVMVDGAEQAAVSGYTGATQFLGFSYSETMRPITKAEVAVLEPTANELQFTLTGTPITGQIRVTDAEGTVYEEDATAAAGKYVLKGAVIEFAADDAGKQITVQYRYTPSQLELQFNDRVPFTFSTAPELYGRIGVILAGEVFTDQFDASVNWNDTEGKKLVAGENGRVTLAESGVEIPGYIIKTPDANNPYLGIRLG